MPCSHRLFLSSLPLLQSWPLPYHSRSALMSHWQHIIIYIVVTQRILDSLIQRADYLLHAEQAFIYALGLQWCSTHPNTTLLNHVYPGYSCMCRSNTRVLWAIIIQCWKCCNSCKQSIWASSKLSASIKHSQTITLVYMTTLYSLDLQLFFVLCLCLCVS